MTETAEVFEKALQIAVEDISELDRGAVYNVSAYISAARRRLSGDWPYDKPPLPVPQESEGVASDPKCKHCGCEIYKNTTTWRHVGTGSLACTELRAEPLARPSLVEIAEEIWARAMKVADRASMWNYDLTQIPYTPPSSPKPSSEKE
jgi:hypothetical protein